MSKLGYRLELLKGAYSYTTTDLLKPSKRHSDTQVGCIHCGRTRVTLRKLPDGNYICNDCNLKPSKEKQQ